MPGIDGICNYVTNQYYYRNTGYIETTELEYKSKDGTFKEKIVPTHNAVVPLNGIPSTQQAHAYSCGAATTMIILRLYGVHAFENSVAEDLNTGDGTNHFTMVHYLESYGLKVEEQTKVTNKELKRIISEGKIAMFFSQGWDDQPPAEGYSPEFWSLGHVMIPIGWSDEGFLFRDSYSSCGVTLIPYEQMDNVWHYQTYNPTRAPGDTSGRYIRPLYVIEKPGVATPPNLLPSHRNPQYATLLG